MSLVKSREKRSEEEGPDRGLICVAHGCPLRWSVSINNACSYHAWEEVKHWPAITSRLHREGPWERERGGDSPTVRDMKTRLRAGHKFTTEARL